VFASADEAVKYIQDHEIELIDLKIAALTGRWLHVTIPARGITASLFESGVGFDGSSGAGFAKVESADLTAVPDPATAFVDPFHEHPTISFLCDTVHADDHSPFPHDPRQVAKRAESHLLRGKLADQALFAPEFEFHVFDRVELIQEPHHTSVRIEAAEVYGDGVRPRIPAQRGYMRVPPADQLHDLRSEIMLELQRLGIPVRYHHHEVGAAGQCEIETELTSLVRAADNSQIVKYVVKNVAARRGKFATFMPKPIYGAAGNGMHVHQLLARNGQNLFYDARKDNYAALSDIALHYIAGLLEHGAALTGLTNPSTNSYKRLVEGYEAPVSLFFSLGNRSAAIRVPGYATSPQDKRIEYRPPDFTGNIYLTLSAMLLAGLDGVQRKLDPAARSFGPFDVDIAAQPDEFRSRIAVLPRSLPEALGALERDHAFLCEPGVFSEKFLSLWRQTRLAGDAREVALRPHPYEYELYLDT